MATDFFARQERARQQSRILFVGMALAVLTITFLVYLVAAFMFSESGSDGTPAPFQDSSLNGGDWLWNPSLFVTTTVLTLGIIGLSSLIKIAMLGSGGESVALALGGRPIPPGSRVPDERRLLNVVEEMALASGVPVPKVFILEEEPGINAFAAGYSPDDAAVAVTRGLLDVLDRDELQGVIAHEFSHILNGDMRINIRLIGVVAGILLLAQIGEILIRTGFYSSAGSRRDGKNSNSAAGLALFGLALVIIGSVGVLFGNLIKAAISRQREFLADASAVQFTRNPHGIAGALKKIGAISQGSIIVAPNASEASHMFFSDGIARIFSLFATHPPLEDRIRALDPTWDGQFPKTITRRRITEPDPPSRRGARTGSLPLPIPMPSPSGRRPGGRSIPGATLGLAAEEDTATTPPPVPRFNRNRFMDTVGRLPSNFAELGEILRSAFSDTLLEAASDPFSARAVIYALLMSDDPEVRARQEELIAKRAETGLLVELQRIEAEIRQMPRALWLPLVELTHPALMSMTRRQYEPFRQTIRELTEADNTVSLFEYLINRLIIRGLDRHFGLDRGSRQPRPDSSEIREAAVLLLASLANAGASSPQQARQAFQDGLKRLGITTPIDLPPRDQTGLDQIHAALKVLERIPPELKPTLLEACVAAINSDQRVTIDEAELLRAVAAVLDCPAPPLWADHEAV